MNWEQSKQVAEQLWRQLKETYGVKPAEKVVKALFRQVRPKPPKPSHVELAERIAADLLTPVGPRISETALTARIAQLLAEQK